MQPEILHHTPGGLGEDTARAPASSEAIVDALGTAWSMFTLYEDPRGVEAFVRAVETVGNCPGYPWLAEAAVDGFIHEGEPVATRREGSIRLAQRIFGLGAAALELAQPPSADDLIRLFALLASTGTADDPNERLRASGVHSISLLHREMLHSGTGVDAGDDILGASGDGSPEAFVRGLLKDGADADSVAARFVDEYERVHALLDVSDAWGAEEVVHAFVDGFWYLPGTHRGAIFGLMLERRDRPENTAFLDQFGGLELVELNRLFGSSGHPLLTEYLRVAAEEGGRHRDDLDDLVMGPETGDSLAGKIVEQVAAVLRASGPGRARPADEAIARLRAATPRDADRIRSSVNALRGLFYLAADSRGLAAPARAWSHRMAAALSAGDLTACEAWLGSLAGLELDDGTRRAMLAGLDEQLDAAAVDTVTGLLIDPPPEGPGVAVRRAAPLFTVSGLVRELGSERSVARRKRLLGALQIVARIRPGAVLAHLDDPRWFVVRNVLTALGASRCAEAAGPVRGRLRHSDHRVRSEALQALHRLDGVGSVDALLNAVGDPHDQVRTTVRRLLAVSVAPGVDERLTARLDESTDLDERILLIEALARRKSPIARRAVETIARRRFSLRARTRALSRAARRAMEESDE